MTLSLAQFSFPALLEVARRSPGGLAQGQVWRLLTPLLIHPDGILQLGYNMVLLALSGPFAERRFGSRAALGLYLAGGLAGNLTGALWDPTGGGASVGVMGMLGALAGRTTRRGAGDPLPLAMAAVTGAALAGLKLGPQLGITLAAIGSVEAIALSRHHVLRPLAGTVIGLGVVLAALSDNHGPALLAGAALGLLRR